MYTMQQLLVIHLAVW